MFKLAGGFDLGPEAGQTVQASGPLGIARAVVSRFNVTDRDGDWTLPGAFTEGAEVPVSAYGHKSWEGALPVGRAVIHSDREKAWADVQFFLTTQAGRETWEVVRDLGPLGSWSYGYRVLSSDFGPAPDGSGKQVQFLRQLEVHEVSPVLVGAGILTQTDPDSVKADVLREFVRFQRLTLGPVDPDSEAARDLAGREYARFVRDSLAV